MSERASDSESVDLQEHNETTIRDLSAGLLGIYEPKLNEVKENLKELINKQNDLQIAISNEKKAFSSTQTKEVYEMVLKTKAYKDKVTRIKMQMHQIHQRTKNLRAKALEIQELKVNQCATKLQQLHYEESLVASSKRTPRKS
ncbi:biogenesis of lysosome-related organelles complex 1 subunit 6 isoform X2 [Anopheles bellator]|uniref:biogenesis of lysosome-related organelles complex 1 subunit 6 isoform X2 n=1 Tax=Anopheles bellator TaxID=139047 RepID=UPI0026484410|nr:biogenesis of lysosome-related organelles complex 1 subunit 6 isoform X2 [Anopheles bellator]